jgi:tight adherence protein C
MAPTLINLLIGIGFALIGLLLILYAFRLISLDRISQRIQDYVTSTDESDFLTSQMIDPQTFSESLIKRAFFPIFTNIGRFLQKYAPGKTFQDVNRKLTMIGNPLNLRAPEFYGIRFITILVGIWLAFQIVQLSGNPDIRAFIMAGALVLVFLLLPTAWLDYRVRHFQDDIRLGLPDALDMLSVCSSAGLGFDQALVRISNEWNTPIGIEFGRLVSEMDIGVSRQESLRNMVARLDVTELSSFVAVVIQSEKLGMSISEVLRSQAEQMRVQRQYRAKEVAQKLPAKMMFPLAFLVLPALLIVVLGPAMLIIGDIF